MAGARQPEHHPNLRAHGQAECQEGDGGHQSMSTRQATVKVGMEGSPVGREAARAVSSRNKREHCQEGQRPVLTGESLKHDTYRHRISVNGYQV